MGKRDVWAKKVYFIPVPDQGLRQLEAAGGANKPKLLTTVFQANGYLKNTEAEQEHLSRLLSCKLKSGSAHKGSSY